MITSKTRALAIIGDPIEHSLTPRIQNAAWRHAGLDYCNLAFRVSADDLECAVRGAQALGMLGLMVTIPHKEAVIDFCDDLHETSERMKVANLLHFESGRIIGHSSDGWAAIKSLQEAEVEFNGAHVAILGGGGAARSLAMMFALSTVIRVDYITILNRTLTRAQIIADEIDALGMRCRALPLNESNLSATLPKVNLLINATSIGMHPNIDRSPVPSHLLHEKLTVFDIVYTPLETRLLRDARLVGAKAVDGLGMLIYTNVYAGQICSKIDLDPQIMRVEARLALGLLDDANR